MSPFNIDRRRFLFWFLGALTSTIWSNKSLASDRTIVPKRRGATIAPDDGVPLVVKGMRSKTESEKAIANHM